MHSDSNLNSFFEYHNVKRRTRNTQFKLLEKPKNYGLNYRPRKTFPSVASNFLIVFVKMESLTKLQNFETE